MTVRFLVRRGRFSRRVMKDLLCLLFDNTISLNLLPFETLFLFGENPFLPHA